MRRSKLAALGIMTMAAGCVAATDDSASAERVAVDAPTTIPFRTKRGIVNVPVEVRSGRAFIGDMGFGRIDNPRLRAAGLGELDERWPDGKVPYCFEDAFPSRRLTEPMKEQVREAMDYISERVPQVRFIEGSCNDAGLWLSVFSSGDEDGNARASVGYSGIGGDDLELGLLAEPSVIRHELGHVLGLRHEQARQDRDAFVEVCLDNVEDDREHNYDIAGDAMSLTPYDYHSIMHYGADSFLVPSPSHSSCEGGHAMVAKQDTFPETPAFDTRLGRMDEFTRHDINALALMYGRKIGTDATGDRFGSAVAVADFDGDGYSDVVVGAPQNAPGLPSSFPALLFYKGTERVPAPFRLLTADHVSEDGDQLGAAMVVGDFNSDGFPDLAVGAPRRRATPTDTRSGAVYIYYGGQFRRANYDAACAANAAACTGGDHGPLVYGGMLLPGNVTSGLSSTDGFGSALAVGDFNGDGRSDLVVGAPGMTSSRGRVFLFRQSPDPDVGIIPSSATELSPTTYMTNDLRYGAALVTADFNGDGHTDLVVGSPATATGAGAVYRFSGSGASLVYAQKIQPSLPKGTLFGASLAAGALLDLFSGRELVVGAPAQENASGVAAGAVHIYKKNSFGVLVPHDPPIVSGASSEERFGHALATTNVDAGAILSLGEILVGAPMRANGGRVVILKNTNGTFATHQQLLPSSSVLGFGAAFATGSVRFDQTPVPLVWSLRIFVGAPDSVGASALPFAGSVQAYRIESGQAYFAHGLTQETSSPFAAP